VRLAEPVRSLCSPALTTTASAPAEAPLPPSSTGRAPEGRRYSFEILAMSFAALLIEISYTRVISFKLFYYYTYLVIGLALLGMGAGGVAVALSGRLRRASTEAILTWGLLGGAVSVVLGYVVIAELRITTFDIWIYEAETIGAVGNLLLICLILFIPFAAIGVMIATLFGRRAEHIGRLYFADLLGAGIACAIVVFLISTIGPPATIMLAGFVLAATGLRLALRGRGVARPVGAVLAVVLAVLVVAPGLLPDPVPDRSKGTLVDTISHEWSPIFRVDVDDFEDTRLLIHDGLLGSVITKWDGDKASLADFEFDGDIRSFPFRVLDRRPGNEMIIGAAGGHEVLASLYFDAENIDAIELNPVTHDLVTGRYEDFAGNLADQPGVNYLTDDGRSFLARSDKRYDLIWYPAPDSYSATNVSNAGAFVLSESYLYTSETIVDSLEHLADGGILAAQFGEANYDKKTNRTTRYTSTARKALEELGVEDVSQHILVATTRTAGASSLSTVLVKREPFTDEEVQRFVGGGSEVEGSTIRFADGRADDPSVTPVITLQGDELDRYYDDFKYSVGPITDDGPFFWHFARFGDVLKNFGDPIDTLDPEDATGERVLILLLTVAAVLGAVFLLLPFIAVRKDWRQLPRKGTSAVYFASLGFGFMFFEITLIQRLTLFLGYPTYSLTVTLASILLFTGIGALLSGRWFADVRRAVPILLGAITVLALFYLFALKPVTDALLELPLGLRVVVAFALLAPLGLCLGAFMPVGVRTVAGLTSYDRQYVAWAWAVNGFASVVGAVLTTMLAMSFGFQVVLWMALGVYLVALAALRSLVRGIEAPAAMPAG
jgi:hypothetical protein